MLLLSNCFEAPPEILARISPVGWSKIRFVAQERELQPIDFANQEAAIPIFERQVRLWPGLVDHPYGALPRTKETES